MSWIGDLYLGEAPPTRGPSRSAPTWTLVHRTSKLSLWTQAPGPAWKGYPIRVIERPGVQAWLVGELYGVTDVDAHIAEVVRGATSAAELNGHFLLLAATAQGWQLWTDRFGTLHAYVTRNPRQRAVATFLPHAAASSRRALDWQGLTGYFACNFFPDDRTHFEDVGILRRASHFILDAPSGSLGERRYWQWQHRPERTTLRDAASRFAAEFRVVMSELVAGGRIALPISGGLDSRTTVAFLDRSARERVWAYSYGYDSDSVELAIAGEVARARQLNYSPFVVSDYLFARLPTVVDAIDGLDDVTQCRQAAVVDVLRDNADYVIAAHWGDVWFDTMGAVDDATLVDKTVAKMRKPGSRWLLEHIAKRHLGVDPEELLHDQARAGLAALEHIDDPDFRLKAYKTDHWSFRFTTTNLRMYQAGVFPRLPFYDTRIADLFCGWPSELVAGRQLQVECIKRYAPDLARITWQQPGLDLYQLPYARALQLPRRVVRKVRSAFRPTKLVQRNWEVQFLSPGGREQLDRWLLAPGLRLHDLVEPADVRRLVEELYAAPDRETGYPVSILLSLSSWLELHAAQTA